MNRFEILEQKFGSKSAVARALGLPDRTYYDWRNRRHSATTQRRVDAALDNLMYRITSPTGCVSGQTVPEQDHTEAPGN